MFLALPSCSKTRSGGSTRRKGLARGKRRRRRQAWMGMTRTTATIQRRQGTLGNVQGLGQELQPHRGVCSHIKGSIVGAEYRLNFRSNGARVCKPPQNRSLGNTRPTRPHPGSRPYLGMPRGAPRTVGNYSSPLSNPGPRQPIPLLFYALHAYSFRLTRTHRQMVTRLPSCPQNIRRSRLRADVPVHRHRCENACCHR